MRESTPLPTIPLDQCVVRHVYRLHSRNLCIGVYDGDRGFIGIREKFDRHYLDTEYHWDTGAPHGTAHPQEDMGALPDGIATSETIGVRYDIKTKRPVEFDRSPGLNSAGFRGWYFTDTNEVSSEIRSTIDSNKPLFDYLTPITNAELERIEAKWQRVR